MSANSTLDDALVTNWAPYFQRNGTIRPDVTVGLDCQVCGTALAIDHAADNDHESYTVLLCGHVNGVGCIRTWTAENPTCPVCRKNLQHQDCRHVSMPAFEHGAGYNIHDPPFQVLGPNDHLSALCVECDRSRQPRDVSNRAPGLGANLEAAGEFTEFLNDDPWGIADNQRVRELQGDQSIEDLLIQDAMNRSLLDRDVGPAQAPVNVHPPEEHSRRHRPVHRQSDQSLEDLLIQEAMNLSLLDPDVGPPQAPVNVHSPEERFQRHRPVHRQSAGEASTTSRSTYRPSGHRQNQSRASSESAETRALTVPRRYTEEDERRRQMHLNPRSHRRSDDRVGSAYDTWVSPDPQPGWHSYGGWDEPVDSDEYNIFPPARRERDFLVHPGALDPYRGPTSRRGERDFLVHPGARDQSRVYTEERHIERTPDGTTRASHIRRYESHPQAHDRRPNQPYEEDEIYPVEDPRMGSQMDWRDWWSRGRW
ncbi:hypothetical protein F5Y18DRAFT_443738 [Xylariaceae sp. FL1019]|nr:hypothetical protein F5Y18DRAFT_443738 [Xylariaceae sp. FL1019]